MVPWARPSPQPKWHLDQFSFFTQMTTKCPYTLQWNAPFPLKIACSHGDLDPHLKHGSVGPPESLTQLASRSVQPFLQGSLVWQTDRQTNANQLVTIGHIYVCSTAMQPNNTSSNNYNSICMRFLQWQRRWWYSRCNIVVIVGVAEVAVMAEVVLIVLVLVIQYL